MLGNIFYNHADARVRAGWRIVLFLALFMLFSFIGQALIKYLNDGIPQTSTYIRNAILVMVAAIAATIAVPLARKFVDRRSVGSLGIKWSRHTASDIIFGFVLSGLMALSFFLLVRSLGLIEVSGYQWTTTSLDLSSWAKLSASTALMGFSTLLFLLGVDAVVAWWEELVFRGYLFRNMLDGLGAIFAIAISCVLYGVAHITNPDATWLSSGIIIVFGLFRIYGLWATNAIWLSFGAHLGWNFFQGPVFGFGASGNKSAALVQQEPSGADWLSGGAFGPEGSILILPILAVAFLAMRYWVRGRSGLMDAEQTTGEIKVTR